MMSMIFPYISIQTTSLTFQRDTLIRWYPGDSLISSPSANDRNFNQCAELELLTNTSRELFSTPRVSDFCRLFIELFTGTRIVAGDNYRRKISGKREPERICLKTITIFP